MAGKYSIVLSGCSGVPVEFQVWVQGAVGTEVWLGIKLAGSKGSVIGGMPSGKLQRLAAEESRWWDRLRGKGKRWMVQRHRWEANGGKAVAGRGIRGEVMRWYLPVRVVDQKELSGAGVRVVVQIRRVAVGMSAGAYTQTGASWVWCRHSVNRRELAGITDRLVHADGQEEVLVLREEASEEWTGQAVEGTDWRNGAKDEWATEERVVLRGTQFRSVDRDQVYDKG